MPPLASVTVFDVVSYSVFDKAVAFRQTSSKSEQPAGQLKISGHMQQAQPLHPSSIGSKFHPSGQVLRSQQANACSDLAQSIWDWASVLVPSQVPYVFSKFLPNF